MLGKKSPHPEGLIIGMRRSLEVMSCRMRGNDERNVRLRFGQLKSEMIAASLVDLSGAGRCPLLSVISSAAASNRSSSHRITQLAWLVSAELLPSRLSYMRQTQRFSERRCHSDRLCPAVPKFSYRVTLE
jgi:hypothetical protein